MCVYICVAWKLIGYPDITPTQNTTRSPAGGGGGSARAGRDTLCTAVQLMSTTTTPVVAFSRASSFVFSHFFAVCGPVD